MKKSTLLFTLIMAMSLVGCNTVHGFGKDVKKVGEAVENAGKK
jgi:entericidin A